MNVKKVIERASMDQIDNTTVTQEDEARRAKEKADQLRELNKVIELFRSKNIIRGKPMAEIKYQ
jgi:hypothetical protein